MFPLVLAVALDLTTAARASPRPRECRGATSTDGVWVRMRGGDAQRYCELLARGYARLAQTPQEALLAARSAEALAGALPTVRLLISCFNRERSQTHRHSSMSRPCTTTPVPLRSPANQWTPCACIACSSLGWVCWTTPVNAPSCRSKLRRTFWLMSSGARMR